MAAPDQDRLDRRVLPDLPETREARASPVRPVRPATTASREAMVRTARALRALVPRAPWLLKVAPLPEDRKEDPLEVQKEDRR